MGARPDQDERFRGRKEVREGHAGRPPSARRVLQLIWEVVRTLFVRYRDSGVCGYCARCTGNDRVLRGAAAPSVCRPGRRHGGAGAKTKESTLVGQ